MVVRGALHIHGVWIGAIDFLVNKDKVPPGGPEGNLFVTNASGGSLTTPGFVNRVIFHHLEKPALSRSTPGSLVTGRNS